MEYLWIVKEGDLSRKPGYEIAHGGVENDWNMTELEEK